LAPAQTSSGRTRRSTGWRRIGGHVRVVADRRQWLVEAASATWTPPARDVGVPISVRQVVGDPRDDRSEEEREVEHRRALMFASCSPPATTMRGYVRAPASRKPRVVAVMNKDSALELFALEDRPAAAGDPIAFVRSLEGEFDRRQALTLDHTIIENRLDRQQAEPSVTSGLQRQVGWLYQVEIVEVPQFRLDDAPRSEECVLRSSTCRHRVHAHHRRSITQSRSPAQTESGRADTPAPGALAAWSACRQ